MRTSLFRKSGLSFLLLSTAFLSYGQQRSVFQLMDEKLLLQSKHLFEQQQEPVFRTVKSIIARADKALLAGPFSVTFNKTKLAPSHNPNDYLSQAPYWWPDPEKSDGLPYIRKDGRRNPEIYQLHDRSQLGDFCSTVKQLGLAYFYTADEKYALKANTLLNTWFIQDKTRMNPNLTYGQYVPGLNDGRGIGIIETRGLTNIPDALALLAGSKSITPELLAGIKDWFKDYTTWLLESENGKSERSQLNNHGTNYDLQLVDFALFTDRIDLARKVIHTYTMNRIPQQFTLDGAQPLELARTKSWDYVNMNLDAWCRLAILSQKVNMDLWNARTAKSGGIKAAVSWLIPYASGEKKWTHEQIGGTFGTGDLRFIMEKSNKHYKDLNFEPVFLKIGKEPELE